MGYQAATTFENDIAKWLPEGSAERIEHESFKESFLSSETLVASWPGCDVASIQLREIEEVLSSNREWFQVVSSGASVEQVLCNDLELSDKICKQRMEGFFSVGHARQTLLVLQLNRKGVRERSRLIQSVKRTLVDNGIPADSIRFAGSSYFLHNVDQEGFWSPLRIVPGICGVTFLLCWGLLGQFSVAFFINQLGLLVGSFSLAIAYLSGLPLNSIVWTLPTLTMLLTSSTALHFVAYYRESILLVGADDAAFAALRKFIKPGMLCCLTSCIGLSSLMFSTIAPVFQFGMFGATSVCFSFLAVVLWLPMWLKFFPYVSNASRKNGRTENWNCWAGKMVRFRKPIIVLVLWLLTTSTWLVPQIETGVSADFLFHRNSGYLKEQEWLTGHLGNLNVTKVSLTFENANEANDLNRMRWLLKLHYQLKEWPEIAGVYSAGTFAPRSKSRSNSIGGIIEKKVLESKIRKQKTTLAKSGLVSQRDRLGAESWLLSLKTHEGVGVQAELEQKLSRHLNSEFDKYQSEFFKKRT